MDSLPAGSWSGTSGAGGLSPPSGNTSTRWIWRQSIRISSTGPIHGGTLHQSHINTAGCGSPSRPRQPTRIQWRVVYLFCSIADSFHNLKQIQQLSQRVLLVAPRWLARPDSLEASDLNRLAVPVGWWNLPCTPWPVGLAPRVKLPAVCVAVTVTHQSTVDWSQRHIIEVSCLYLPQSLAWDVWIICESFDALSVDLVAFSEGEPAENSLLCLLCALWY